MVKGAGKKGRSEATPASSEDAGHGASAGDRSRSPPPQVSPSGAAQSGAPAGELGGRPAPQVVSAELLAQLKSSLVEPLLRPLRDQIAGIRGDVDGLREVLKLSVQQADETLEPLAKRQRENTRKTGQAAGADQAQALDEGNVEFFLGSPRFGGKTSGGGGVYDLVKEAGAVKLQAGRPMYKNPGANRFIFYGAGHWIVGNDPSKTSGSWKVQSTAETPDLITELWEESDNNGGWVRVADASVVKAQALNMGNVEFFLGSPQFGGKKGGGSGVYDLIREAGVVKLQAGRPTYRNPSADCFLFYLAGHWIVGHDPSKTDGWWKVRSPAVTPDLVTEPWEELRKGGDWVPVADARVVKAAAGRAAVRPESSRLAQIEAKLEELEFAQWEPIEPPKRGDACVPAGAQGKASAEAGSRSGAPDEDGSGDMEPPLYVAEQLKEVRQRKGLWSKVYGPQFFGSIPHGTADAIRPLLGPFRDQLQKMMRVMSESLVQRDEVVKLMGLATLAGQHCLLFGPPGSAKSLLSRRQSLCIADCAPSNLGGGESYFELVFHAATTVDDVCGPTSLKLLQEQGKVKRNVECMLPYASMAFLDEAFKAPNSLLSVLLPLLNERYLKNGSQMLKDLPLWSAVVASNEVPTDSSSGALFDRLLIRLWVDYVVGEEAQENLMNGEFGRGESELKPMFSLEDFKLLNLVAKKLLKNVVSRNDRKAMWKRRLEHHFVVESEEDAKKLLQERYLEEHQGGLRVAKDAASPDFQCQTLKMGWQVIGFTSIQALEDRFGKKEFPVLLSYHGEQEEASALSLVGELFAEAGRLDAREKAVCAKRGQSVEGGGRLSDRRRKQIGDLLRLIVLANNRFTVSIPDLYLIVYCLWKTQADWQHLSTFWLRRLQQEMRGLDRSNYDAHNPKDNIFLPQKVQDDLCKARDGQGFGGDDGQKELLIRELREKAKVRRTEYELAEVKRKNEQEALKEQRRLERKRIADQQQAAMRDELDKMRDAKLAKQAEVNLQKEMAEFAKQQTALMNQSLQMRQAAEEEKARLAEERENSRLALEQLEAAEQARLEEEAMRRMQEGDKLVKKGENTRRLSQVVVLDETSSNLEEVRNLLAGNGDTKCRADVNEGVNGHGDSSFTSAIYKGKFQFVAAMHAAVPQPNPRYIDSKGDPPLVQAVKYLGESVAEKMVQQLLQFGCDVTQPGSGGNTPLHFSCSKGYKSVNSLLLGDLKSKAGIGAAKAAAEARNGNQQTPKDVCNSGVKTHLENFLQ